MKIGYLKNTIADIGRDWLFASWLTRLTDNTPGSTNYSNKSQCWTPPNLRFLIMMLITETRYCTTALTLSYENTIGITPKSGNYTQREVETLNQNQHDQSAELLASVGTR